ncbi:MAG: restriction endonuclease subunit S [Crocinitomicaceae bacterium]|nr:restriction endonuclease subunit S [Crocinitomicaceae bacterium]
MPNNWKKYKLGELVQHKKGFAFKSAWFESGGVPVVRISDTTENSINLSTCHRINNNLANDLRDYMLKFDEVVIATVGSWPPNYSSVVGKVIRVPKEAEGALLNQNAVKLISNHNLDNRFLYYSLKAERFLKYITTAAQGSANQASIKLTDIFDFIVDLPPLKEQQAIAEILSALDDKIELNLQTNKTLEEMANALYKHWFVDFGPFLPPGRCLKDGGGPIPGFVESELGLIPEGWEVKKLSEISINYRKVIKSEHIEHNVKYLGLEHLSKGSISITDFGIGEDVQSNKYSYVEGDILFGKLRPYFKKVGVAPFDGICSTDILVIRPIKFELFGYVLGTLIQDSFINYCTSLSAGTKMPRIEWNTMGEFLIATPKKIALIESFNELISSYSRSVI